jgi:GT2 family glycosyltransferase
VVSVCIPVVSNDSPIEACLDSLANCGSSVEIEVLVVSNGLEENGYSSLRKRDDIVLVRSQVNSGFSGGNNIASDFARGRYLLLLNDDSVVEAGFVDRLLSTLERDTSIAAVGGKILWSDGTLQEAGSVLWSDGWVAHAGAGFSADSMAYNYVRYSDYVSANGLLVDRRVWDAVGGFDERYFPAYYEDVDLCLAFRSHGYRVAYEPRARLRHLESQSTSNSFRNFLLIRNRNEFVSKWSTVLQEFADHPDPIDQASIDVAVSRAEQSVGRVLVVEDSADPTMWRGLVAVEALAEANWSVMVSVPADQRLEATTDLVTLDRMVDLGVDVREEGPEELLSIYKSDLDAVIVSGSGADFKESLRRPGGSSIPMVNQTEEGQESVVALVSALAPRSGDRPEGVSDLRSGAVPNVAGIRIAAATDDAAQRDLKFTEAEVNIRREYCEFLEHEVNHTRAALEKTSGALDETRAALDETRAALDDTEAALRRTMQIGEELQASLDDKQRYIDALPSVRAKKWIADRHPNHKS